MRGVAATAGHGRGHSGPAGADAQAYWVCLDLVGRLLPRDVVLTRDEVDGLMAGQLTSGSAPTVRPVWEIGSIRKERRLGGVTRGTAAEIPGLVLRFGGSAPPYFYISSFSLNWA